MKIPNNIKRIVLAPTRFKVFKKIIKEADENPQERAAVVVDVAEKKATDSLVHVFSSVLGQIADSVDPRKKNATRIVKAADQIRKSLEGKLRSTKITPEKSGVQKMLEVHTSSLSNLERISQNMRKLVPKQGKIQEETQKLRQFAEAWAEALEMLADITKKYEESVAASTAETKEQNEKALVDAKATFVEDCVVAPLKRIDAKARSCRFYPGSWLSSRLTDATASAVKETSAEFVVTAGPKLLLGMAKSFDDYLAEVESVAGNVSLASGDDAKSVKKKLERTKGLLNYSVKEIVAELVGNESQSSLPQDDGGEKKENATSADVVKSMGFDVLPSWQQDLLEDVVRTQFGFSKAKGDQQATLTAIGNDADPASMAEKLREATSHQSGSIPDLLGKWMAAAVQDDLVLYGVGKEGFNDLSSAMAKALESPPEEVTPLVYVANDGSFSFDRNGKKISWKADDSTAQVLEAARTSRLFGSIVEKNEQFWKQAVFTEEFFDSVVYGDDREEDVRDALDRRGEGEEKPTKDATEFANDFYEVLSSYSISKEQANVLGASSIRSALSALDQKSIQKGGDSKENMAFVDTLGSVMRGVLTEFLKDHGYDYKIANLSTDQQGEFFAKSILKSTKGKTYENADVKQLRDDIKVLISAYSPEELEKIKKQKKSFGGNEKIQTAVVDIVSAMKEFYEAYGG